MLHVIKEIRHVSPFYVIVRFNTGELLKVDLEEQLRQWSQSSESTFQELLNPDYFTRVKLNREIGAIYWENGIDLCPDVLYALAEKTVETSTPEGVLQFAGRPSRRPRKGGADW